MDRYHSIVWPMVGYHWKTIESNGCQTKDHRKTIEPNGCQTKKTSGPMVDRPKTIEKPLVPMVSSKPFIQWQWWPWKPLMFHNGSNHSPKTPCLGRLNKLTIILIKYIKFVSSPRPNPTSPHFIDFEKFWTLSVILQGNCTRDVKDCPKQLSVLGLI